MCIIYYTVCKLVHTSAQCNGMYVCVHVLYNNIIIIIVYVRIILYTVNPEILAVI